MIIENIIAFLIIANIILLSAILVIKVYRSDILNYDEKDYY